MPLQAADVDVAGAPVAFWRDFLGHAGPADEFWAVADHDGADLTKLPPVSMVTGWWDLFLPFQLRDYAAIRAAGVQAQLTVGPTGCTPSQPEVRAITQQDVAWLGPSSRSVARRRKALRCGVFLQQAGNWAFDFEQWPPPGVTDTATTCGRPPAASSSDGEPGEAGSPAGSSMTRRTRTPSAGGPLLQPPGEAGGR